VTPLATAIDSQGRICVADKLNRMRVYTQEGAGVRHLFDVGGTGSAPGEFQYPSGLAYTGGRRMVVADSENHRIQVLQEEGAYDVTPPVSTATLLLTPNAAGWVNGVQTVTLTATDDGEGVDTIVVESVSPAGPVMQVASGAQLTFADGVHVLEYYAIDRAGNRELPKRLELRVDTTAPALTCPVTRASVVWPVNHKMVPVSFTVTAGDPLSGAASFVLASATSSEPDNGIGDGDRPNDLQGWTLGTPDTSGFVRAERSGSGAGRVYTFRFEAQDGAGNVGACTVSIGVAPASPVR
jgi:hypothetical protein